MSAVLLSKEILLKCWTNDNRYSSAGVGGLCEGIFSSLQGWLCVRVLRALQCAKNSVGLCRQSHVSLNLSRMLFRVTYNGQGFAFVLEVRVNFSPEQKPNRNTADEIMQKDDSKSQAGTNADSEQNDQDLFVSQHNAKPPVVGSQCHGTLIESVPPDLGGSDNGVSILFKAQEVLQAKADSCDLSFVKEIFLDGVKAIRKSLGSFPPTPELVEKLGWD